ncbi:MAG: ferritin-like domain-containing protein [Rhodoferax sp.]|nr:ferritin-like domain-containing protein [Rhodoferax sp.]
MELRRSALEAFCTADPQTKLDLVHQLWEMVTNAPNSIPLHAAAPLAQDIAPGRPALPTLVDPKDVPRRSPFTSEGHAALMHSIAHIEFNAINLALDAVWRFDRMPDAFYLDWLRVAHEEAKHFGLLRDHLQYLGYVYGDFVAHDGLWTICESTRHDIAARMALVPRTLEARGLDATPMIQARLKKVGTANAQAACAILDVILREEVGHVAIGNHWYRWLCERDRLDPRSHYLQVAGEHRAPRLKPPFNLDARRRAGFTESELEALPSIGDAAPTDAV